MEKPKMIDVDGTEAVSKVLLTLLNTFPGLDKNKKIEFSTLSESSGIGLFPTSGAAVLTNKKDILGHVSQTCLYPFIVVYRASPRSGEQKIRIKEFLDVLGKWLEQQPVTVNGKTYKLSEYPDLAAGDRKITSIERTNPAHLDSAYDNGIEDWVISATLKYENEFDT